jgi:membrane protein required for colicin V production
VHSPLAPIDLAALAIVGLAMLRGVWLGLIREVMSVAALVVAVVVVRRYGADVSAWMVSSSQGGIAPVLAPWLAGTALAIGSIVAGAVLGRLLRSGAKLAWLGMPDRVGGALLGAAEGVLLCAILLVAATHLVGRRHPLVEGSRSIAALERLEHFAGGKLPAARDVAAPPPGRSGS